MLDDLFIINFEQKIEKIKNAINFDLKNETDKRFIIFENLEDLVNSKNYKQKILIENNTNQENLWKLKQKITMIRDFEYGGGYNNYKHFISHYKISNTNIWEKAYQKRMDLIEFLRSNQFSSFWQSYKEIVEQIFEQIYILAIQNTKENIELALEIRYFYFQNHHTNFISFFDELILRLNMISDKDYFLVFDELFQIQNFEAVNNYLDAKKIRNSLIKKDFQIDDYPWGFGVWKKV